MTSEANPPPTPSPFLSAGRTVLSIGRAVLFVVLALVAVYLGYRALRFSALSDYFLYTAEFAHRNPGWRLNGQFLLVLALFIVFALLFYRRIMSPIGRFET